MVHPDFQKKGIFSQLFKKSMETAESEGYDIMLVIPNSPYSYQHFQKIGFYDIAGMERFKFHLSPDTLTSKYVNSTPLPVSVKKLLVFTGSFLYSRLIPRVNHSYEIGYRDISECIGQISDVNNSDPVFEKIQGIRSNAFIRWKFFQEGAVFKCLTLSEQGKILGYLIIQYKEGDNNAFVVDMDISKNDRSVISGLIAEARHNLKKNNFERLWIYIMENDSLLSNFFSLRNGFLPRTPKSGKLQQIQIFNTLS